jgi:hypothetical protein
VANEISRESTSKTTAETFRPDDRDPMLQPQQEFVDDQRQLDAPVGESSSTAKQRRCILDMPPGKIGAEQFMADVKKKRKNGSLRIEFAVSLQKPRHLVEILIRNRYHE